MMALMPSIQLLFSLMAKICGMKSDNEDHNPKNKGGDFGYGFIALTCDKFCKWMEQQISRTTPTP